MRGTVHKGRNAGNSGRGRAQPPTYVGLGNLTEWYNLVRVKVTARGKFRGQRARPFRVLGPVGAMRKHGSGQKETPVGCKLRGLRPIGGGKRPLNTLYRLFATIQVFRLFVGSCEMGWAFARPPTEGRFVCRIGVTSF